jgi:RimJ/RimL family protein N-acetyltransferase
MRVPDLDTQRLRIRELRLDDLSVVHQIRGDTGTSSLETRRWLEWTVLGYEQLANLRQPPYNDRAIAERATDELIGLCGLVPCLGPYWGPGHSVPEVGLYWTVAPAHQRRGYATEAGHALITYAFTTLHLQRIIATTNFDNAASIAVMRKLGMRIETNTRGEPEWLQVVGVLERA